MKNTKSKPIIVVCGAPMEYNGTLLELKTNCNSEQWEQVTAETFKYKCFMKICRDIAMPMLHETWDKEDKKTFKRLRQTIESMKSLDPPRMLAFNEKKICDEYAARALKGVRETQDLMKDVTGRKPGGDPRVEVSNL